MGGKKDQEYSSHIQGLTMSINMKEIKTAKYKEVMLRLFGERY